MNPVAEFIIYSLIAFCFIYFFYLLLSKLAEPKEQMQFLLDVTYKDGTKKSFVFDTTKKGISEMSDIINSKDVLITKAGYVKKECTFENIPNRAVS
jgi:hypothetical protein